MFSLTFIAIYCNNIHIILGGENLSEESDDWIGEIHRVKAIDFL